MKIYKKGSAAYSRQKKTQKDQAAAAARPKKPLDQHGPGQFMVFIRFPQKNLQQPDAPSGRDDFIFIHRLTPPLG